MYWAYAYLALTLALLAWVFMTPSARVVKFCAFSLIIWYVLANATYQVGIIEDTGTVIASVFYILIILPLAYVTRHPLPYLLFGIGVAKIGWTAIHIYYEQITSPYFYKAMKNAAYLTELGAVAWWKVQSLRSVSES